MAIAEHPSAGVAGVAARDAEPLSKVWPEGVRIVVWLQGEQDASTAAGLAEMLAGAAAVGEGDVVVDLSEVQFMDVAIVKVLVRCQELLQSQSRQLLLRAPSRSAQRLLGMCGVLGLVEPGPAVVAGGTGTGSCVPLRGPG